MAKRDLPDADPLDGTESLILGQKGRARKGWVGLICDYVLGSFQVALATALTPILTRLSALEGTDAAQAARDQAQDAAVAQEAAARKVADDAEALARQAVSAALGVETQARQQADTAQTARGAGQDQALATEAATRKTADDAEAQTRGQAVSAEAAARVSADTAEATARSGTDTAQAARLAALETRAEEAAHFTATAALPAITALLPVTLTLTNLVPAKAGDVLKAGETVSVEPATSLPAGVNIAAVRVPADGQVAVQLATGLSVAPQSTLIVWNITALR